MFLAGCRSPGARRIERSLPAHRLCPSHRRLGIDRLESRRLLAAGDLDTTFGDDGLVLGEPPPGFQVERADAVAVQSDGKIVVAGLRGSFGPGFPPSASFLLSRYNSDGSLDTSFGVGGRVLTGFPGEDFSRASAIAIQPDGRIVVAGTSGHVDSTAHDDFALARYNTNGTLDGSFGANGLVATDLSPTDSLDNAFGLALQGNGQIVVVGSSDGDFAVVRYDADGELDAGFGTNGIVFTDFSGGSTDVARDVVIEPDGQIVVAGQAGPDFGLARYDTDGDLDATFGVAGLVTTDFPGSTDDIAYGVALQSDGRIVAAGQADTDPAPSTTVADVAVAHYDTDGSLDNSFDGDGRVVTDIDFDFARDVVIQADGQIVVVGDTAGVSNLDFFVLRYNDDGSLDANFGAQGVVTTEFPGDRHDEAHAVALQADGRIVVAGRSGDFVALARYLATDEVPSALDTIGLYSPANAAFHLRTQHAAGPADMSFLYGAVGWLPLVGDWNGNGTDTVGAYNPNTGVFFLRNSNSAGAADLVYQFGPGGQGWVPLAGDWDGDGVDTAGLYDPTNSAFFLRNSHAPGVADVVFQFGAGGQAYSPLAGNWDGAGGDTVGLYQPVNSFFLLRNALAAGPADLVFQFGAPSSGALPLAGNWDGQPGDSVGIYRRTDGAVFLRNTNTAGAADIAYLYGPAGSNWVPVTGDWNGPSLLALSAPGGEHRRPPNAAVLETLFADDEDWLD